MPPKPSERKRGAAPSPPSEAAAVRDAGAAEPQPSLRNVVRPLVGSTIVFVLALLAKAYLTAPVIGAPPAVQHSVPRVTWSDDPAFFKRLLRERRPVILVGTPASHWAAMGRWTPEYIEAKVPVFKDAYRHAQPVFTFYDPGKPLAALPAVKDDLRAAHNIFDVKTADFFAKARSASADGEYLYFSGPLEDFDAISDEVDPIDWMHPKEGDYFTLNVWMGYNGTTAHTHYDIFHNFNVQLYGRKRFLLMPPSDWPNLYHYPRLHPKYRQSQVDYEAPDLERFPKFANVVVHEAVMEAGDTLYLPPYWNHRVTAVDLSISVNVFSETRELNDFYELQKTPLDFLGAKKGDLLANAADAAQFLLKIADELFYSDEAAAHTFVQELFDSRFAPLSDQLRPGSKAPDSPKVSFRGCHKASAMGSQARAVMQQRAQSVVQYLRKMPYDIQLITLGNYMEEIGRVAVGAPNIFAFFRDCLA